MRVERAAGEKAAGYFEGGNFAAAIIYAQDDLFGAGRFVDIHFAKSDFAVAQEILHAAAIAAPAGTINCDNFIHRRYF